MKMVGKISVLAMAMALACVLVACGGSGSTSSASASASSASASSESASADATSNESAGTANNEMSELAGIVENGEYINEFFGITFEAPEGWIFSDEAQIAGANAENADVEAGGIDMMAQSADGATTIAVAYTATNDENAGQDAAAHLAGAVQATLDSAKGAASVEYSERDTSLDFENGRSIPVTLLNVTVNGTTMCFAQACVEQDGNFLDIVVQGASEDDVIATVETLRSL